MIFRVRGRDVCSVYVAASVIRIRLLCHDTEVMVVRATSAGVVCVGDVRVRGKLVRFLWPWTLWEFGLSVSESWRGGRKR